MAYLIFENNSMKFFTKQDPNSESSIIQLNENSVVKEVADDFVVPENMHVTLVNDEIVVQENVWPTVPDIDHLRHVRNEKLKETDLWGLRDFPATDEQLAYRQQLRDITDNYTSLNDVVWPEKPV